MVLKSFCGCISIQSGVVILAFSYIEISIIILISNLHLLSHFTAGLGFLLCFLLVMLIAGAMMITTAYKEDRKICLVALLLVGLVLLLSIVGSALSFANRKPMVLYVCIEDRCPETLWLVPLQYRKRANTTNNATLSTVPPKKTTEDSMTSPRTSRSLEIHTEKDARRRRRQVIDSGPTMSVRRRRGPDDQPPGPQPDTVVPKLETTTSPYYSEGDEDEDEEEEEEEEYEDEKEMAKEEEEVPNGESGYVVGAALFIAILLCVVNSIFFLFCCLIVYSFYKELKYLNRYHYKKK